MTIYSVQRFQQQLVHKVRIGYILENSYWSYKAGSQDKILRHENLYNAKEK